MYEILAVLGGFVLIYSAVAGGVERTWVSMRPITPGEVDAYVASGEWRIALHGEDVRDELVFALESDYILYHRGDLWQGLRSR